MCLERGFNNKTINFVPIAVERKNEWKTENHFVNCNYSASFQAFFVEEGGRESKKLFD